MNATRSHAYTITSRVPTTQIISIFLGFISAYVSSQALFASPQRQSIGALPPIEWSRSLPIGTKDDRGNELGGTEIRSLVAFDGKLFAGNSYWTDTQIDSPSLPGAQVFVLPKSASEGGKWQQDLQLTERLRKPSAGSATQRRRYFSISALQAITFKTTGSGKRLPRPINLLLASVWDRSPGVDVFVRTEGTSDWSKSTIARPSAKKGHSHVRSFILYRDPVTRTDMVFAGISGNRGTPTTIVGGTYERNEPGRIRWSQPEPFLTRPGPGDRVTSFAIANGKLYATVCGKLYERKNGKRPAWKMIYQSPNDYAPVDQPGENGYRGATTVRGKNGDHLLLAMEGKFPEIRRIDPITGRTAQEIDLRDYLSKTLNRSRIAYVIPAYNDVAAITLPDGTPAHFIGIETFVGANAPNTWQKGLEKDAWFIVRLPGGRYLSRKIIDLKAPSDHPLIATRSIVASPFPQERGKVIYAAGYDANHVMNIHHNTGWIYRGRFLDADSKRKQRLPTTTKFTNPQLIE